MKMVKNIKSKIILILGILIILSSLFSSNITLTDKSRNIDNITTLPLCLSQSNQYQLEWYRLWNDGGVQGGKGVAVDSFGNIYQAGYTMNGPYGRNDGLFIKTNSLGVQQWNVTWGTVNDDGGFDVAVDSNNYIYVVGTIDGFLLAQEKIILLKYDSSGVNYWNRTWSGLNRAQGRSVIIDSDDNIYVAGYANDYPNEFVLIKYDNSGTKLWERIWGGPADEGRYGVDIAVDSQNNIYLTGYTTSFGAGSSDAVLIKYDNLGNELWNRTWGGVDIDGAESVTTDNENNIYIAGYTDSFGGGSRRIFIVKYNNLGSQIWNTTYTEYSGSNCKDLISDPFSNIYLTGYCYGPVGEYFCFLKYDKNGSLLLNKTWGWTGSMITEAFGITINPLYDIYISGYTDWYNGVSDAFVLLKYSEAIRQQPLITINSPDLNQEFGTVAPEFNITIQHHYLLDSIWYTIDGGLTNFSLTLPTNWIEGDNFYSEVIGPIDQTAWNLRPDDYIPIRFYAADIAGGEGFEERTVIKETINLIHVEIVYHSYSTDEFEFIFFIYNETGNGIDSAMIQMWWDGTEVSNSVLNLGGGSYLVSVDPITVLPTEDPILLNMTISAVGYDNKYYEAYFAVDPEVIDKTIPDRPYDILGYIIIISSIIGGTVIGLVLILSLRKRRRKSKI
ncbi:MAG: SBBP repeat-containing protein [Candidatus Hodarchaeota archaeon]